MNSPKNLKMVSLKSGSLMNPVLISRRVPYAWQPLGDTLEVPSFRTRRLKVLGFLTPEKWENYCYTYLEIKTRKKSSGKRS